MAFHPSNIKLRTGEPVCFRFKECLLYGMLHHPPSGAIPQETGIVILNPGPTDRNGPHRLYFELAERFATEGYPVLRFDARGVGESEGEWNEGIEGSPILDVFTEIQKGIWVPDTEAAINFIISRTGVHDVVLGGLCGGAITALLAGAEHPKVLGMFLMGTPITLSSATSRIEDLPEQVLRRDARMYIEKLLRPSAWFRLLTLKTDFSTFWGVLKSRLCFWTKPRKTMATETINTKMNPLFIQNFKLAVTGRKKVILIYSENDYLWHEFKEYFLPSLGNESTHSFDLTTLPNANHNVTETDCQDKLQSVLLSWLVSFTNPVTSDRK